VYLPLVIAGLFGLTAPRLALRLPLGSRSSGRRNPAAANDVQSRVRALARPD
jgi:hypothetical protein